MIQINKDIKIKDVTNIVNEKAPSFSGIVNRECKGKLWVDNIEIPRIAIVESFAVGSFAILGTYEAKEDFVNLKDFFDLELLILLKNNGYDCFEFSIESESIRKAYCITFDNKIVAVMIGTACFNNIIAIDIETEEKYRRMGLAYTMAAEFIADCLKNDFVPQWDCIESNSNSYDLARKLGFEKTKENTVYWFNI